MTEYRLFRKGRVAGTVDVTNRCVTIFNNDDLVEQLDSFSRIFKRAEFIKRCGGTTFFLIVSTPIEKMVEVLIRIRNEVEELGYSLEM